MTPASPSRRSAAPPRPASASELKAEHEAVSQEIADCPMGAVNRLDLLRQQAELVDKRAALTEPTGRRR